MCFYVMMLAGALPSHLPHELLALVEDIQAIRAVSFHPNGELLAIGSNASTLRILSCHNLPSRVGGQRPSTLPILQQQKHFHRYSLLSLSLSLSRSFSLLLSLFP